MKIKSTVEKISKILWWLISLGTIVYIVKNNEMELFEKFLIIPIVAVFCPIVQDCLFKKIGYTDDGRYFYYLKMLLVPLGFAIAYIISVFLFGLFDNGTEDDLLSLFRIVLYCVYLLVIFMFIGNNKKIKYLIFGIYYLISILLEFASGNIQLVFIDLLSFLGGAEWDDVTYNLFLHDFIKPVKESILTYVLFDTVLSFKENNIKMSEKEEKKNKIKIDGETIVLENIVSDFEIETDKIKVDIKVKS